MSQEHVSATTSAIAIGALISVGAMMTGQYVIGAGVIIATLNVVIIADVLLT